LNTTTEILTVDGVVLNTLAKNIESIAGRLHVPGKRTANQTLPGKHGTLYVANKKYEANVIVLPMWVRGCDDDGSVPSGSTREEFFTNLDVLTNLFMRDGLRDVSHTLPDGSIRQCFAEVLSSIDFSVIGHNPLGKYSVEMEVPDVFWQDVNAIVQARGVAENVHYPQFDGLTAPLVDAIITVTGPANSVLLTDTNSGEWFQYAAALGVGEQLVVDCAEWTAKKGAADVIGNVSHSDDYFLPLTPNLARQLWVSMNIPGSTGGTSVSINGRRKYLVG
jgi:hypothetical protein